MEDIQGGKDTKKEKASNRRNPLTKRKSMVKCSRSLNFAGWRRGHLVTLIT